MQYCVDRSVFVTSDHRPLSVGKDKQSMSIFGEDMNVCDVCCLFGSSV